MSGLVFAQGDKPIVNITYLSKNASMVKIWSIEPVTR